MTTLNLLKSENYKKKCTANIYAQKPGSVPGFFMFPRLFLIIGIVKT